MAKKTILRDGPHVDIVEILFYDGIGIEKDRRLNKEDYQHAQMLPFLPF